MTPGAMECASDPPDLPDSSDAPLPWLPLSPPPFGTSRRHHVRLGAERWGAWSSPRGERRLVRGWVTVQVRSADSGFPVFGSVVRISDAPTIMPQSVVNWLALIFPALWTTSGYGGTNEYGVNVVLPAGWTIVGSSTQLALVQSAQGTAVLFQAHGPVVQVAAADAVLWSGTDAKAVAFRPIAPGTLLRVDDDDPSLSRLLVFNLTTKDWAWIAR